MSSTSEAPRDPRLYVRITTDIAMNPKLAVIDSPAASWTYVCSITYSGGSFTDGHFPVSTVLRIAGTDKDVAEALVEQELWHLPGHDCNRCPQPKKGWAYVHDFLKHQRSKEEAQELTDKRRNAGRAGAAARWGKTSSSAPAEKPQGRRISNEKASSDVPLWDENDTSIASAMPSAMANGWQTDGKAMAEERRREETTTTAPTALPESAPPPRQLALVPDAPLTISQRSKAITDAYAAVEPLCKWPAVNGIVAKAIKVEKWSDTEIRDAVLRLAADGRSVTVDVLRTELNGLPPMKSRATSGRQLTEHNGLMLNDRNMANVERARRIAALEARGRHTQAAIEGGAA
jgi:hypothetical protein